MDEKMTEILNDLNKFHSNIANINKINESFKQYIETISKEKDIIDASNKETVDKIKYYHDNLDTQIEALKNSTVSFIAGENKTIQETYQNFLFKIDEDKKHLDECCNRYLNSIHEQDELLKENQELMKSELTNTIEQLNNELTTCTNNLQATLKKSIDDVNVLLTEVNKKYDQMIQMFSEMDMLNEFKKNRKLNKIMFILLGVVIVAIVALLIVIILK